MIRKALVLLIGLILTVSTVLPVQAALPPHRFRGLVNIGGSPAPDGTLVSAHISTLSWSTTTSGGTYGYDPNPFFVPSDDPTAPGGVNGNTIIFKVAGVQAATYAFHSPDNTSLNLELQSASLSVATVSVTSITHNSASLNGNLTWLGGSPSAQVSFDWGIDTNYSASTTPVSRSAVGAFSAPLTGLTPSTIYHFRAKAVAGAATAFGSDMTVTTPAVPPVTVTSLEATQITQNSAALNGNLGSLGDNSSVQVSFEWGTTTVYGNITTPETRVTPGGFSINLTGLGNATTYHFRARVTDGDAITTGSDMTFSTPSPMAVTTLPPSSIAQNSVVFNGSLVSLGGNPSVDVSFEWGLNTSYGNITSPQNKTAPGAFSATISGLQTNQVFHYRARIGVGSTVINGTNMSVTTSPTATLAVTILPASAITQNSATLHGNLTSLGGEGLAQVAFEWGTTTGYGNTTAPESKNAIGAFTAGISGLLPGTVYHYRARVMAGTNTAYSSDLTFTATSTQTPAPNPTETTVAVSLLGGSDSFKLNAQGMTSQLVKLQSTDGKLGITLTQGTAALNSQGQALTSINATALASTLTPIPQYQIISTYELTPSGSTFNPPLTLTMGYASLPVGLSPQGMVIAVWENAKWTELTTSVDDVAKTVTARLNHFSIVAVQAKKLAAPPPGAPADIRVDSLTITPENASPDETVTITALLVNKGASEGRYTLTLNVNGATEQTKDITLAPEVPQTLSFQVVKNTAGKYSVELGNKKGGFSVTEPGSSYEVPWWVWLIIVAVVAIIIRILFMVMKAKP